MGCFSDSGIEEFYSDPKSGRRRDDKTGICLKLFLLLSSDKKDAAKNAP